MYNVEVPAYRKQHAKLKRKSLHVSVQLVLPMRIRMLSRRIFLTNKHTLKDININKLTINTQTHTDTQNDYVCRNVHNFRHVPACMYWFLLRNT